MSRLLAVGFVVVLAFLAAALFLQTGWNSVAGALGIGQLSLGHALGLALGIATFSWLMEAARPNLPGSGS